MEGDEYFNLEEEPSDWSGKLKFSHLCRVCANPNGYLIPIFEGEGLDHELGMKIQKHLPIQVFEIDSLPKQMCYQCASTLIAWHDLTIGCIEADKKLRQLQCEKQQEQQQSQVQDSEDDKVTEFFDTPSVEPENIEPEKSDVTITQSRTAAESSPSLQTQVEKKIPCTKKKRRVMEKPSKVKMVLLRGPTAGPSRHLTATKSQSTKALDIVKAKGGTTQEFGTTERSPLTSFRTFRQAKHSLRSMHEPMVTISTMPETVDWIKSEGCNSDETQLVNNNEQVAVSFSNSGIFMEKFTDKEVLFRDHIKMHRNTSDKGSIKVSDQCSNSSETIPELTSNMSKMRKMRLRTLKMKCIKQTSKGASEPSKRNLSCEICGKVFNRTYHLKRHKRTHKSQFEDSSKWQTQTCAVDEPIFHCELCGKNFSCKSTLKSHHVVHTGEKPFTCHICGKSFSQTGLYYHLKHVHAGIKNHSCDICGRSFAAKPAMEDHRRIHTGERPYVCSTCGKSFKTKATLYIHNKIHTDIFPFSCSYCGKLFRNQHEMVKHQVTHTGEKPHVCDLCGRGFRARNEMSRHRMLHSDDKPFVCSACGLGFKQERYLKRHMKAHHPGSQ